MRDKHGDQYDDDDPIIESQARPVGEPTTCISTAELAALQARVDELERSLSTEQELRAAAESNIAAIPPDADLEANMATPMHEDEHPARRGPFLCVDAVFAAQAANARDSIKLLAEIAEAAREVRKAEKNMAREGNFEYAANADWGRKAYVLDALLAKYREAQDAE